MENLESLENMYLMHKDSIVVDIKSRVRTNAANTCIINK